MKAITAISNSGSGVSNGRVSRRPSDHGSTENAEIKVYLSKLKELVPFMPKNRKLSKLEIIQNVIDYICDLQSELETYPVISKFDTTNGHSDESEDNHYNDRIININSVYNNNSNNNNNNNRCNSNSSSSHLIRKPLVDRSSPNTILSDSEVHQQNLIFNQQLIHSHSTSDKSA